MNNDKIPRHPPTHTQPKIADVLHAFCHHLVISKKERYITLDAVVGRSQRNKNAISISGSGVTFMVTDWTAEQTANELAIPTKRHPDLLRRLIFPALTIETIQKHRDFFTLLAARAFRESQMRQGYYHFAFSASEITLNSLQINGKPVTLEEGIKMLKEVQKDAPQEAD